MYGEFKQHLNNEIKSIKEAGLYKDERIITSPQKANISVSTSNKVLNMCANNYLGLSDNQEIIKAVKDGLDEWGYGLSSVRFICGTQKIHKKLENEISDFLGTEDTILYSSCFDANGGLFETLSVLCLAGIYYYSFPSIMINPNIVGIPLWALLVLYLYKVSQKYSIKNWLIIAVLAALSTLCKYEAAFLFIPAFIFLLINKETREQLIKPGFWLAAVLFILLLIPHIIWLFQNDFSPILYALDTANTPDVLQAILDHIFNPVGFVINIVATALPALILLFIFKFKNKNKVQVERNKLNTSFIILVALGAYISTFAISLIVGTQVNPYWTITYYNFTGTAFLYFLRPEIKEKRFKIFAIICFLAVIIPPVVTGAISSVLPPTINGRTTIIQYPAQRLADYCRKTWFEHTNRPFKYLASSGGDAYYVNCYIKDRPTVYRLMDGAESPWVSKEDLEKNGAYFLWLDKPRYASSEEQIKEHFHGKFIELPSHSIPWLTGSIYDQCKGHPTLENAVLRLSKYIPFLKEKIKPLKIKGLIMLPKN